MTTTSIVLAGLVVLAAACTPLEEHARSEAALEALDPATPDAGIVLDGKSDLSENCPVNICGGPPRAETNTLRIAPRRTGP